MKKSLMFVSQLTVVKINLYRYIKCVSFDYVRRTLSIDILL